MNKLYLPDQNAYPQFQESVDSNAPKQEGSLSLPIFIIPRCTIARQVRQHNIPCNMLPLDTAWFQ